MTSGADKMRFALGSSSCFLWPLLFYRDFTHIYVAAGIIFGIALALSLLTAGRARPRNWKRISLWFLCLSVLIPALAFLVLVQFREGL